MIRNKNSIFSTSFSNRQLVFAEGLQTARTLARNASFLVKAINMAKEKIGMPKKEEPRVWTNFFQN